MASGRSRGWPGALLAAFQIHFQKNAAPSRRSPGAPARSPERPPNRDPRGPEPAGGREGTRGSPDFWLGFSALSGLGRGLHQTCSPTGRGAPAGPGRPRGLHPGLGWRQRGAESGGFGALNLAQLSAGGSGSFLTAAKALRARPRKGGGVRREGLGARPKRSLGGSLSRQPGPRHLQNQRSFFLESDGIVGCARPAWDSGAILAPYAQEMGDGSPILPSPAAARPPQMSPNQLRLSGRSVRLLRGTVSRWRFPSLAPNPGVNPTFLGGSLAPPTCAHHELDNNKLHAKPILCHRARRVPQVRTPVGFSGNPLFSHRRN